MEEGEADADGAEEASRAAATAAVPAADVKSESEADRWARLRPEERRIAEWIDSLEGKTIVDITIEGGRRGNGKRGQSRASDPSRGHLL